MTVRGTAAAMTAIAALVAAAELAMQRAPICRCGIVRLWHGDVHSGENSQQLLDWHSLTHLVHGVLFYAATRLLSPRTGWRTRLVWATLVEAGWEVLENSPMVINRYRAVTVSWG